MRLPTVLFASLLFANAAHASPASDYLAKLDGKWRGGGVLAATSGGKETRVRCSLRNAKKSEKLAIAGRCASSAGTRPIRGELSAAGSTISSKTVSLPGVGRMRNVRTSLSGSTLVMTGSVSKRGKAVPVRTRLTPAGKTLKMNVQSRVNGRWTNRGTLTFRR